MGIVPGSTTTMIPVTSWCSSSRAVVMTGTMSRASLSSPYISETTTSSLLEVKTALRREGGEREEKGEKGEEKREMFHRRSTLSYFCWTPYCINLSYSGKLVRENFADCSLALPKDATPQICGETFAKVFSFKNFPLYGTSNY